MHFPHSTPLGRSLTHGQPCWPAPPGCAACPTPLLVLLACSSWVCCMPHPPPSLAVRPPPLLGWLHAPLPSWVGCTPPPSPPPPPCLLYAPCLPAPRLHTVCYCGLQPATRVLTRGGRLLRGEWVRLEPEPPPSGAHPDPRPLRPEPEPPPCGAHPDPRPLRPEPEPPPSGAHPDPHPLIHPDPHPLTHPGVADPMHVTVPPHPTPPHPNPTHPTTPHNAAPSRTPRHHIRPSHYTSLPPLPPLCLPPLPATYAPPPPLPHLCLTPIPATHACHPCLPPMPPPHACHPCLPPTAP